MLLVATLPDVRKWWHILDASRLIYSEICTKFRLCAGMSGTILLFRIAILFCYLAYLCRHRGRVDLRSRRQSPTGCRVASRRKYPGAGETSHLRDSRYGASRRWQVCLSSQQLRIPGEQTRPLIVGTRVLSSLSAAARVANSLWRHLDSNLIFPLYVTLCSVYLGFSSILLVPAQFGRINSDRAANIA